MDEQKKPNCGEPQMKDEPELEGVQAAEESIPQPEAGESEALKEEVRKLKEEVARGRADYFNLRTRMERDRENNAKLAAEQAINEMLPVFIAKGEQCAAAGRKFFCQLRYLVA